MTIRFLPLGEAALTVELGKRISPAINARVHALHASLNAAPLPGVIESVPAYRSLTLYYDPLALSLDELQSQVKERFASLPSEADVAGQSHIIPVAYGGEFGPDLESVAEETSLSPEQVIAEHSRVVYRVYMVGFSPGFPYLGRTSAKLQVGRLATPRTRVPAGSVAIAGRQTGLYPSSTPGGWRLLGRTGWRFFDPMRLPPARLQPGDQVRFRPTSPDEINDSPEWGKPATPAPVDGRPVIEVLGGGLLTTVQDSGRYCFQSFGVPVAGTVDTAAMRAANLLVGNSTESAVLEITLAGPVLRFWNDALVAVTGADLALWVEWPDGKRWNLPGWLTIYVRRGSTLGLAGRKSGCRAYLAIAGGLAVPQVLGSASTCLAGSFGGHAGRKLERGDRLMVSESSLDVALRAGRSWPVSLQPRYSNRPEVRVLPGSQWGQFTRQAQAGFLAGEYTVQPASDRVGLRVKGPALQRKRATEIISSGVTAGSIQVPNDGQPIVLMADRQTAGGYAQIAVAISADLPLLAQLVPGDRVTFRRVTMGEAVAALHAQRAAETRWLR